MEIAKCWLIMGHNGSNVPLKRITPTELVLLEQQWKNTAKKHPVHNLEIIGTSERPDAVEKERLRGIYGKYPGKDNHKVDDLYPGAGAKLPQTFEETGLLKQSQVNLLEEPVPEPDTKVQQLQDEMVETEEATA